MDDDDETPIVAYSDSLFVVYSLSHTANYDEDDYNVIILNSLFTRLFIDWLATIGRGDRDCGLSIPVVLLAPQVARPEAAGDNQRTIGGAGELAAGQRGLAVAIPKAGQSHVLRPPNVAQGQVFVERGVRRPGEEAPGGGAIRQAAVAAAGRERADHVEGA